jgi:hypothetical protein
VRAYFRWNTLEPTKGNYAWATLDEFLSQLDGSAEALIGIKTDAAWGTEAGTAVGRAVTDQAAYTAFLQALVTRCAGKVKYFMNDSEANNNHYWGGSNAEYVIALALFFDAVTAVAPTATVVLGGHDGSLTEAGVPGNATIYDAVFNNAPTKFTAMDVRLYDDPATIATRVNYFTGRMAFYGISGKPMYSTELGGPKPGQFTENDAVIAYYSEQSALGRTDAEIFAELIADWETLPPQMQMFVSGCSQALEDKRTRIHARDMTIRAITAMAAGVEKMWFWTLTAAPIEGIGLHPIFGKMRLMNETLSTRLAPYNHFRRMSGFLRNVSAVRKIATSDATVNFYELTKGGGNKVHCLWETRNLYSGEDSLTSDFYFQTAARFVKIADVFGNLSRKRTYCAHAKIGISETPVFVEEE